MVSEAIKEKKTQEINVKGSTHRENKVGRREDGESMW